MSFSQRPQATFTLLQASLLPIFTPPFSLGGTSTHWCTFPDVLTLCHCGVHYLILFSDWIILWCSDGLQAFSACKDCRFEQDYHQSTLVKMVSYFALFSARASTRFRIQRLAYQQSSRIRCSPVPRYLPSHSWIDLGLPRDWYMQVCPYSYK